LVNRSIKEDLRSLIEKVLSIQGPFQVKVKSLNAIVRFTTEIFEGDELEVIKGEGISEEVEQEELNSLEVIKNKMKRTKWKKRKFVLMRSKI